MGIIILKRCCPVARLNKAGYFHSIISRITCFYHSYCGEVWRRVQGQWTGMRTVDRCSVIRCSYDAIMTLLIINWNETLFKNFEAIVIATKFNVTFDIMMNETWIITKSDDNEVLNLKAENENGFRIRPLILPGFLFYRLLAMPPIFPLRNLVISLYYNYNSRSIISEIELQKRINLILPSSSFKYQWRRNLAVLYHRNRISIASKSGIKKGLDFADFPHPLSLVISIFSSVFRNAKLFRYVMTTLLMIPKLGFEKE
jgi:hypothetical protein